MLCLFDQIPKVIVYNCFRIKIGALERLSSFQWNRLPVKSYVEPPQGGPASEQQNVNHAALLAEHCVLTPAFRLWHAGELFSFVPRWLEIYENRIHVSTCVLLSLFFPTSLPSLYFYFSLSLPLTQTVERLVSRQRIWEFVFCVTKGWRVPILMSFAET